MSEKENYWLCKFSLFKMQSPSQEKMLLSDKQMYEYRCNYVTFLKWHLLTIVVPSLNLIFSGMLWKKLIERKVNGDSLWRGLSERRGYGFFRRNFYWISFRFFLPICFILLCGISSDSRFLCLFARIIIAGYVKNLKYCFFSRLFLTSKIMFFIFLQLKQIKLN